jgi:hypothetical protein
MLNGNITIRPAKGLALDAAQENCFFAKKWYKICQTFYPEIAPCLMACGQAHEKFP